jgi:hypothetical protein
MNYKILNILDFGRILIDSEDLDPIYVMLYKAKLEEKLLKRWLLAYWCFYHAGVASHIAESKNWHAVATQAQTEKWPRGKERRHFRGKAADKALAFLNFTYPEPEAAIEFLCFENTYRGIKNRISSWYLFGPWICFKAADMLDRVIGHKIHFDVEDLEFYKEPAQAAKIIDPLSDLKTVVLWLIGLFSDRMAPPAYDRSVGVPEVESCLCKWKSHINGRYQIGNDIREIKHGISGWGDLADELSKYIPAEVV